MKLNHVRTAMQFTALAGALAMTACSAASTEDPAAGDIETTAAAEQAVTPQLSGVFEQGAPTQGEVGKGSSVEQGSMGKGAPSQGIGKSAPQQGGIGKSAPQQGGLGKSAPEQGGLGMGNIG